MTAAVTGIPAVASVAPAARPGSATANPGGFADLMKQAMASVAPAQARKDQPQGKQGQQPKDAPAADGSDTASTPASVGTAPALITADPATTLLGALDAPFAGPAAVPDANPSQATAPQAVPDLALASVAMSVSVAMEVADAAATATAGVTPAATAVVAAALTGAASHGAAPVPAPASLPATPAAPNGAPRPAITPAGLATQPPATGSEAAPAAAAPTLAGTPGNAAPASVQGPSRAPKDSKAAPAAPAAAAPTPGQPAPSQQTATAATAKGAPSRPVQAADAAVVASVVKAGAGQGPVPTDGAPNQAAATAAPGAAAKADLTPEGTPATPAPAFMAPAAPFTVQASTPAVAAAPALPVPGAFAEQIAKPVFTLATTSAPGEHVMVIKVTPDNLGPVTVQAHITGSSVRIELFAPNDAGREALRQVMPDLKRDIAASGLQTQLNLSSGNQPGAQQGDTGRNAFNQRGYAPNPGTTNSRQLLMDTPSSVTHPGLSGTDAVLDVMA